ncbi:short-chain dehydrogenase [Colletotrichum simmondsii]|uniref:Short-chain dehydrogenase n=1 Tax=Colletotrichum simmondsii TaxID=703756 RepID=A0A135TK63_9PEZI|nr:short-chain dehydrogenase [Colletotrichum simmondsii]
MGSALSNLFPPKASFTEANLPDQSDKVFIVTGSSGGLGKELTKILYQKNAKIYMACRSEAKTAAVIKELKELYPNSHGHAEYLHLDLNDLTTIKQSAQEFLSKETRLDVLWNNAGVMTPPPGSKTAQGYELQLGTNNLAPFLFTHFLRPVLSGTVKVAARDSVRVVWVSSSTAAMAPKPPIDFSNMNYAKDESQMQKYARSKAGNVLHGTDFARRVSGEGIISVKFLAHKPINGAYTELFAGLSPTITEKNNGGWVVPFGQLAAGREDLRDKELGKKYWEWTEKQLKPYTS